MKSTIIYIRTSTEDQEPKNQIKDCLTIIKKSELKDYEILEEKTSAFLNGEKRDIFNSIRKEIQKKKIKNLIIWDLDRIYRNRRKLIEFFELCKVCNCKIYSVRQAWLSDLNNIPAPFDEIMHGLMIQIMGWIAEEESIKKSERIKLAVRKKKGKTLSYKGNKWGRRALQSKVQDKINKLHDQGKTIREIHKEVYYYDKSNHKKYVSAGYVHKTISNSKRK